MAEEEKVEIDYGALEEMKAELEQVKAERKMKRKRRLLKEAAKADMHGVCYLSRIPPRMDPLKLRQILSQHAELERIYLTPEDPTAHVHRKRAGGFRGQGFTEGWVEFTNKNVAKRVASMLNGEQIAYKNATREQKLAMELSAAKKEREFYLAKVDQSLSGNLHKRKMQQANGSTSDIPDDQQVAKVIRHFPQTKPVTDGGDKQKPGLSKSLLTGVENLAYGIGDHHIPVKGDLSNGCAFKKFGTAIVRMFHMVT
ncbi:pre-rRNA-processing protein ESF2 [Artemisia annua]|uniref:Pre-rRNA-processing protein ESF2 n=1 Tax=Artemisia annua TaxID=35608 RepID=A0A2U1NAR2_ARTAN|nr:pre-rRNA-processing protein ESF2 [Artemisia annua]